MSEYYAYGYTTKQGGRSTRYESRCKPCAVKRRQEEYAADVEGEAAMARSRRARNPGLCARRAADYRATPNGRTIKAKLQRMRKARMRSGQGDNGAIRAIYAEAMKIEQAVKDCPVFAMPELGYKMHVDHVVPLAKGGLHHEDNLQIIPIGINLRKGVKCPK